MGAALFDQPDTPRQVRDMQNSPTHISRRHNPLIGLVDNIAGTHDVLTNRNRGITYKDDFVFDARNVRYKKLYRPPPSCESPVSFQACRSAKASLQERAPT